MDKDKDKQHKAEEKAPEAPVEPDKAVEMTVVSPAGANLYARPNRTASVRAVMRCGTKILAVGKRSGWVQCDGGWVMRAALMLSTKEQRSDNG